MPKLLDDLRGMSRLDSGNMLGAINRSPDSLLDAVRSLLRVKPRPSSPRIQNIVFAGMGGSAIAGDVLLDWLREGIRIPASVIREGRVPMFVGRRTLFVALSYSGETAETLAAVHEAERRRCVLVGIGSGGRLAAFCKRNKAPFLKVSPSPAPRAALSQMVVAGAIALEGYGVVGDVRGEITAAGKELVRLREHLRAETPHSKNRAKQFASSLECHLPVAYTLQRMSSVARRFKNQLNENSKTVAKFDLLPEAGHNEVEGWVRLEGSLLPILIRDWEEAEGERVLFDAFKFTVRKAGGISPLEIRIRARSKLSRLLAPILFVDYVSVYLAFLRGLDPTPTPWIAEFRRRCTAAQANLGIEG